MTHSTLRKRSFRSKPDRMPVLEGPRPSTIEAILAFSRALRVVDAPPLGKVAMVLN